MQSSRQVAREVSIVSLDSSGREVPRSCSTVLRKLSGATAARIIEAPFANVSEHHHDWPVLSLYVCGHHTKRFDCGEVSIDGPSMVLHAPHAPHANSVGSEGMEQIDIIFDPAWLKSRFQFASIGVSCWSGGAVAARASRLMRLWMMRDVSEERLASETAALLDMAFASRQPLRPHWLPYVNKRLSDGELPTTSDLAAELDLNPAWLRNSYRAFAGEGLRDTMRRKRIERARHLLRTTNWTGAWVAAECEFADESHMIRCFKNLLGRPPAVVRREFRSLTRV